MVDMANSGKLSQASGRVVTLPVAARIDQAPSLAASRQSSSAGGATVPEFNNAATQADAQHTEAQLKNTVTNLNDYVQSIHRDILFNIDETTGRTIITVTDSQTGEEIRKIPSDELLAVATHLAEFLDKLQEEPQIGLLFDTRI